MDGLSVKGSIVVWGVGQGVPTPFEPHANTWYAWFYQGYVYTGDIARGTDVLALT